MEGKENIGMVSRKNKWFILTGSRIWEWKTRGVKKERWYAWGAWNKGMYRNGCEKLNEK